MSKDRSGSGTENVTPSPSGLKRRDLLLSGGSLVAAAALAATGATSLAQAQAQAQLLAARAQGGRKPNILVIFGDDVGY